MPELEELRRLIGPYEFEAVLEEVAAVVRLVHPDMDLSLVRRTAGDVHRLFSGQYEGYRESNTAYHNFEHTLAVSLAMARVMHGAVLRGEIISERGMRLGLIAALFHDTGLIQTRDDKEGTGAKYTVGHEERSLNLASKYLLENGGTAEDARDVSQMIRSTILGKAVSDISYSTSEIELIGKCLAACDLLGQMADPDYLSKLTLLFKEFEEAGIPGFDSELMLLEKTQGFYDFVAKARLDTLGDISGYMRAHYLERHGVDTDPYEDSVQANLDRLQQVLSAAARHHEERFEKGGVVW
jgi:hypothetical protein